ncbi:inactive protein kinase selmodraft_444075 [Phtheirospermum japonicum]|uniref:Inactive protein kinase selmodraft_444075 n=1 Tax=Phtheirospermum japonicum TaxID=374723 RepID=A0A830BQK3_9LAMI|nr:inactive protein kinase selmodraft_444075 [Phtheirospermum japonicum]
MVRTVVKCTDKGHYGQENLDGDFVWSRMENGKDLKTRELKKVEKGCDVAEKVVVAVKASKDIPKTALVWALTHVVQPGDCITLLVVFTSHGSGRKLWGFPRFAGDCASGHRSRSHCGTSAEQKSDITDCCSQMILQLHDVYDPNKVLRLNLVGSTRKDPEATKSSENQETRKDSLNPSRGPLVTPSSSPETFTATEVGTSSVSSSDPGTSPFFITGAKDDLINSNNNIKKEKLISIKQEHDHDDESDSDTENESLSSSSSLRFQPWMAEIVNSHITTKAALLGSPSYNNRSNNLDYSASLREAISFSRTGPCGPPPLCSICQHKTPIFGKPPRWFTYAELELATGGFSKANFLAEGGYGSVHRGVLPDGQTIAVKQHKLASSQGDQEFCSEVEVLSCAQHRNVVMLIGFCIEDGRRLLVYLAPEYAQSGQITEKADVYSFGVVLVELVTGRKAVDLNRPKGQQCLTEWARPLLEAYDVDELVDPRLGSNFSEGEVYCMLHAASLCIRRDPQARPRMSQVLRVLEGDAMDSGQLTPGFDVGSRSGRIWSGHHQLQHELHSGPMVNESSGRFSSKLCPN